MYTWQNVAFSLHLLWFNTHILSCFSVWISSSLYLCTLYAELTHILPEENAVYQLNWNHAKYFYRIILGIINLEPTQSSFLTVSSFLRMIYTSVDSLKTLQETGTRKFWLSQSNWFLYWHSLKGQHTGCKLLKKMDLLDYGLDSCRLIWNVLTPILKCVDVFTIRKNCSLRFQCNQYYMCN